MDQMNSTPAVSTESAPPAAAPILSYASPAEMLTKMSLADKIIGGAAAMGIISTFLPAVSITVEFLGQKKSQSISVIGDWRGKVGLLCFLAAVTLLILLIQKGTAASKNLLYGLLGVCALAALMGIFLLFGASSTVSEVPAAMREMVKGGTSFGTYLFLLCGLAMAAGGFLKAKDQKLIPSTANVPTAPTAG